MGCIIIDFEVLETNNPKKILIGDSSVWEHAKDIEAYFYITLPGSSKKIEKVFNKNSIMTFNSKNLDECQEECCEKEYKDLPDGVYKFKLQSGFEDIFKEKYYLKTDNLQKEIGRKLIKNYDKNDESFKEAMFNVWYLIEVSKSYMVEGDIPNTNKYYNEALKQFKCI